MYTDRYRPEVERLEKSPSLRNPPLKSHFPQDLERNYTMSLQVNHDDSSRYLNLVEQDHMKVGAGMAPGYLYIDTEKSLIEASKRLGESLQRAKEEDEKHKRHQANKLN